MNRDVAILFKNGSKVSFEAQEFDIDLSTGTIGTGQYGAIQKFTYTDIWGNKTPIYLVPAEVAGIVVAWKSSGHTHSLKVH
jgi:hypothetical protein